MSDKQVKIEIDGNLIDIEDFLRGTDKKYILEPNVYEIKKQILTDIRNYLVTEKVRVANSDIYLLQIREVEKFADKALAYLADYAEKLGVEL